MARQTTTEPRTFRKWTVEEEDRVVRQIRAFPHNLSKCFLRVADEIDRTPCAVASHWYTVLSKRPHVLVYFTASSQHVSKNRKNGMGVPATSSIWRRLVNIIRNL